MLKSMTGYGLAIREYEKYTVKAEIKSLNNKFMELQMRMPKVLQQREVQLRNEISRLVERGSVTLTVNIDYKLDQSSSQIINKDAANLLLKEFRDLAQENNLSTDNIFSSIFSFPEVISGSDKTLEEEDWKNIDQTIKLAIKEFDSFRNSEGNALSKHIEGCLNNIQELRNGVEAEQPARTSAIREKIQRGMEAFIPIDKIDSNRMEQEIIYYLEKLDISEELTRLLNHCRYFKETLDSESSNGKKLGFITQEIGREINTIGAKANNFTMQQKVVEMKEELEKMKEQLMNVL